VLVAPKCGGSRGDDQFGRLVARRALQCTGVEHLAHSRLAIEGLAAAAANAELRAIRAGRLHAVDQALKFGIVRVHRRVVIRDRQKKA